MARRTKILKNPNWQGIVLLIAAMWVIFLVDRFLPLERFGLIPRQVDGLIGILTMPFLHGDWPHLVNNTVSLIFLLVLLTGVRRQAGWIVGQMVFMSGGLLWIFGRPAIHIGASSLVFGLIAYLIFSGWFEKRLTTMMIALLVGLFYGTSLLAGILPGQAGISWEGHLCGAGSGFVLARLTARK